MFGFKASKNFKRATHVQALGVDLLSVATNYTPQSGMDSTPKITALKCQDCVVNNNSTGRQVYENDYSFGNPNF